MSKTLDVLKTAQSLREQHQNDIDNALKKDMTVAFNDTKSFMKKRLSIIQSDMDHEIVETQTNLQKYLKHNEMKIKTDIVSMENDLNQSLLTINNELQIRISTMNQDLHKLTSLNHAIVEQAKLKKVLSLSMIPMISILIILLICSICLGYFSNSKYSEIGKLQMMQKEEQAKLVELKKALSMSKTELQQKFSKIQPRN